MKQLLILILIFSFLSSCNDKKTKKTETDFKPKTELKTQMEQKAEILDTTVIYWQTDFDTIRENREVKIGNEIYHLELKTYSLNDSSIIKINDLNKPIIYKDIYHDNEIEIVLKKENQAILKSLVKKSTFKDSLDGDFLKYSVLKFIDYDGIRSNRIYFKGFFNVPDTDWAIGNDFAIFYLTEKKGEIDFWNFIDAGL